MGARREGLASVWWVRAGGSLPWPQALCSLPLPVDAGRRADGAAAEQSRRTDRLGTQPGAARARQGIEREVPRPAAHPDPRGNRHGEDGVPAPCTAQTLPVL